MSSQSASSVSPVKISQANQTYINALNTNKANSTQFKSKLTKDTFTLSGKNRIKVGLLTLAGIYLTQAIVACVKNPDKVMKIANSICFNNKKLFSEPINLEKYYNSMVEKIQDTKLEFAFDEKTVSDETIEQALKKIGVWSYDIENKKDLVKNNKGLLHALNGVTNSFDGLGTYGANNFIEKLDPNISTDDVDLYLKYLKHICQSKKYISSRTYSSVAQNGKDMMALSSLNEDIQKNILKRNHNGFSKFNKKDLKLNNFTNNYLIESFNFNLKDKPESNLDEMLKCLQDMKKGTFIESTNYDIRKFLEGNVTDDYIKARKFYESLNPNVLKKVNIQNLEKLLNIEDKTSEEVSEILNNISPKVLKEIGSYNLDNYVKFSEYYGIDNINKLNIQQKKELLKKLISTKDSNFYAGKSISPIFPADKEEYCKLLDKLSKSIGINTEKLTPDELNVFNKAFKNIEQNIGKVNLNNATFELDFSRNDFIQEAEKQMAKLSDKEKMQVMDYFGFEIKDGKLSGYPININNGEKLKEIDSKNAIKVIENLRPTVEKFSSKNNKVTIKGASKEFNESVNKIFESFPELKTMIQKPQHKTHSFTLDIHTFKVLQNVCSNPKFKKLSEDDKKVLQISSLLHDITKIEGVRDYNHPMDSAFDAYYIIQKLNLPENQQLKVYELIKTHNWLQILNDPKNKDMIEEIAQDIAFDTRNSNTFEMAKILCEADLKSVRKNSSFFNSHKKTLKEMSEKVDRYIKGLHETQIVLPQTKIPKASEMKNCVVKSANGITNKVFYMNKADEDLSKYGFEAGTTKENWTAIVHGLEYPEDMTKVNTFNIIDTEALVSTSFINPNEYRVFRKQGLIFDVNYNDIHAGYESDFGTGTRKILELLKQDYLFDYKRKKTEIPKAWRGNKTEYRSFISEKIREKMNLSPEEYYQRIEKIQDCKSITDIEKKDKEFADGLLDVFKNMHSRKRKYGRQYNEMLISRPKIQGVFAYDKKYEDIPEFLRKYAEENNLPIIIFGHA